MPTTGSEKISVLLVDDHALVRRGFRRLLEDDPAIDVVGEASDGDEAIRLADALNPRVIVMDCALPDMNGLVATRQILRRWPDIAIVMLSMYHEESLIGQAFEAGVRGYVLKDALDVNLADTVKEVAGGATVVDAKIAHQATVKRTRIHGLSSRQLEVLQLVCNGSSNRAIAARLGISANTVAVHRAAIMKTLGIRRVAELVTYALRHRLVSPP